MNTTFASFFIAFFRTSGYISCTLQWLWLLVVALPLLLNSGIADILIPDTAPAPDERPTEQNASPSPLLLFIGGSVTVLMIIISVVMLVRLPRTITQQGTKLTTKASEVIIPTITYHHTISKKKQFELTQRVMIYIKLVLILLPLSVVFFVPSIDILTQNLLRFVAAILALFALVSFALEHGLIHLLAPTRQRPSRERVR